MTFVNEHIVEYQEGKNDLLYVDANNLYGNALSYPLPCSDFQYVDDFSIDDIMSTEEWNNDYGYTLEVDMEYTAEAKNKSYDLPFAPEKVEISNAQFSSYMIDLYRKTYGTSPPPNVKGKLLMTHQNKKNYVIHLSLLKFFVQHGMKVTKIHRTIRYRQARLFADYIQFNSDKRQLSTNEFEKDFFKLKNNCIYGKVCPESI